MYHDFARFTIRNNVSNGERVRQRFDARSTEEDTRGSVRKEIANELGQQFRNVTGAYYGNAESCKRDSSEGNKRRELGSNTDDYVWKAIINLDWKRNNRNVSILRVHYIYVHIYIQATVATYCPNIRHSFRVLKVGGATRFSRVRVGNDSQSPFTRSTVKFANIFEMVARNIQVVRDIPGHEWIVNNRGNRGKEFSSPGKWKWVANNWRESLIQRYFIFYPSPPPKY